MGLAEDFRNDQRKALKILLAKNDAKGIMPYDIIDEIIDAVQDPHSILENE